jgi:hypothetical protein
MLPRIETSARTVANPVYDAFGDRNGGSRTSKRQSFLEGRPENSKRIALRMSGGIVIITGSSVYGYFV